MNEIELGNHSSLYFKYEDAPRVTLSLGFPSRSITDAYPEIAPSYGVESLRTLIQRLEDIHADLSDGRPR